MKVTVLMDNTVGESGLYAEHGLSLWIESEHRILMDTGASAHTWENAEALGIQVQSADAVVLSHGHYDHTGGLVHMKDKDTKIPVYLQKGADGLYYHGEKYIGMDSSVMKREDVCILDGDKQIGDDLFLFSGIREIYGRPSSNAELTVKTDDGMRQDDFRHEQCLVVKEGEKEVLFSGCAHNGILNILEAYRQRRHRDPDAVFSGFHLKKKNAFTEEEREEVREIGRLLRKTGIVFYTGHCTGEDAYGILKEILGENLVHLHSGDIFTL